MIVSGPTRCEPHRSCSFAARSPVSYVPIETCSAPWYDVSPSPRSATSAGRATRSGLRPRAGSWGRTSGGRGSRRCSRPRGRRRPPAARTACGPRSRASRQAARQMPPQAGAGRGRRGGSAAAEPRLGAGGRLDRAVRKPDGGTPGSRAVDEHAVLEGHAAEPELLHAGSVASTGRRPARSAPWGRGPASSRQRGLATRAGPAAASRLAYSRPVEGDDRHHLTDGRRREHLVRRQHALERVAPVSTSYPPRRRARAAPPGSRRRGSRARGRASRAAAPRATRCSSPSPREPCRRGRRGARRPHRAASPRFRPLCAA